MRRIEGRSPQVRDRAGVNVHRYPSSGPSPLPLVMINRNAACRRADGPKDKTDAGVNLNRYLSFPMLPTSVRPE